MIQKEQSRFGRRAEGAPRGRVDESAFLLQSADILNSIAITSLLTKSFHVIISIIRHWFRVWETCDLAYRAPVIVQLSAVTPHWAHHYVGGCYVTIEWKTCQSWIRHANHRFRCCWRWSTSLTPV